MHAYPDVTVRRWCGFARVHADPHSECATVRPLVLRECALRVGSSAHRVLRTSERDEERVALRVDLVPVVPYKRIAQQEAVILERRGVAAPELVQQLGGSLDVGEQEGDRPRRPLAHVQSMSVNRLAAETSPYLLQHADNPVDWYPWGEEALARARAEDKPVLLSIGYAACHWCHVMEHESFEDERTAALMNSSFVCIKVDREERPDLDAVYMDAVVTLTGSGGWPMTVFLTPGGEPFFGGTYYPPEPRHGLPSFPQVLAAVAEAWRDRRDDVGRQAAALVEQLRREPAEPSREPLTSALLVDAVSGLRASFDPVWGGFGGAPQFPPAPALEFLLRS